MLEIIYRCIQAEVRDVILDPLSCLRKALACLAHLNYLVHNHTLAQGTDQCVDDGDGALRKLLFQLLGCHACAVAAAADCGGQRNVQNILALLEIFAEAADSLVRVDLLGFWHRACAHLCIKFFRTHLWRMVRTIGDSVNRIIKGKNSDFIFLDELLRQVSRIFGSNDKITHSVSPF